MMPRIKKPKVFPDILERVKARTNFNFRFLYTGMKGLKIGDKVKVKSGWDNLDSCFNSSVIIGFRQQIDTPTDISCILYNPSSNFEGVSGVTGVGIIGFEDIERIKE